MDEAGVDASPLENKMKKDEELSSDDEEEVSDSDSEEEDDADTIARIQRAHFAQNAAMSQRRRAPARPRPMSQKRKIEAIKNFHDFTKKLKKDTGITMRGLIGKNMLDLSDDSSEDSKSDSDGLSEEEFEVNPSAVHELTEENDSYIDPETGDFVEGKKSVPKPPSPIPEQESLPEVSKVPKTLSISDIINEGDLDLIKNTEISEVEASDLCPEKTAEELLDMKQEQEENSQDYDITDKLKEMGEISVKPVKQEGSDASNSATEAEKKVEEDDKKSSNNALNVRRNIRDVMDEKQLDASTLAAQRQESERLARVQEQQRIIREVQRQIALNRQNKVHQKTLSLLQGGSSILKKSASGHKLNLPNTVMVKLPSGEMKKTTVKQGQVEVTRIPKPGSSGSPGLKLQKTDQKPVRSVSSVVEIVDSSSGGDSSSSSSDSDDCIMLSDSELPPSPEADDDPGNSGLHVNDAYNLPDEQGRVLINMGHPENEEDIFLAPQIARIIKPHQIGGVRFLFDNIIESVERFSTSTGFGCILAHSMGLGKTLQIVCFCDIFLRHTTSKTVLCIMPINTLQNWVAEFNKWLPVDPTTNPLAAQGEVRPRNFPIYVLNDSHKTLQMRAKVVKDWTTTGGVLMIGYELYRLLSMKKDKKPRKKKKAELKAEKDEKEKEKPEVTNEDTQGSDATCQSKLSEDPKQDKEEDPNKIEGDPKDDKKEDPTDEDKKLLDEMYEALVKPGPDLVICDEGHRIKNSHSNISYALKQMRTKRRIVLTGYPLQNNLLEYWCMVDFVRPNYLGSKTEFSNMFERPIQNGQCIDSTPQDIRLMRYRAHVLHSLLVGFVQRRSHAVLQSTLPQKEEYVMLIRFTPLQRKLYDRFMNEVVRCTSVPNPLKAFAICCKIWNHPDVLYNFLKKRSEVNAAIEEDLDLEELGGVTKAGRAARSRAQPRRAAKPRGSAKKPAATITPNTTSSGPANPSGDPNNPYNARYPNSGPPYGPQNQYRPEQPDGSYPPYPYQNSNQGYYPPNQGYNQNYGNNYYPQQQTPYGQNYPQQPYPQNSDQTYNQNYNNWSNGNYYGNSGYYNNAQYPNNQPPQDFNSSQQYPPNYNAAAADQPYHGPGQPPYGNNAGPVQPPYPNNAGATQPPYVDDSGITQPTYPNNSGPNQPPYTNNVAPNQPPYASNAASTATGQPPYPNNSGPNQPPYANNVAPNQPPYASNVASTTTGQPPYPNNSGPNQPPYTNNVAPNQPPYANNVAANQPPYASNSASTAAGQPPFTNSTEAVTPAIQPPYPDPTPATRPPYSNNQDPFVNQQQPPFSQEYPRQDYPGFNANSTDTAAYPAQNQQNYPNPPYQGPYPENSSYGQNSAHPYNPQYDSQQPNYSGFPNGPPVQTPPNDVPPNQIAPKVEPYPLNGSKPDPGSGPPIVPYQNASYNYNQPNTLGYNEANVNSDYPPPYSALPQHLEIKQPLSSGGSPLPTWPITDSMKTENDKSDIKSEPKTEIKSESDSEVKIEDLDTKKIVKDEVKKDTKTEITSPKGKTDNDKEAKKDKTKSGSDSEDDSPKKGKQKGKGREKKKSEPKKRGRKPKARKDRKTSKDKNDESENSDASEKEEKPSKEEELAIAKKAEEMTYDWATELLKDYIPGIIENSAKMQLFFYILNESIKLGDRILLFSQSLFTLNLIEDFLEKNYIPGTNCLWERNTNYYRLDGSTHALEREKLINEFNTNPHVYLFLVSTRAGSLGINLVGANRVIVFDASWNPCHDTQAVCRVYRYGQKKPCFVYRFVMDWCLEKKIYDRQINKQGMADRVVDECNPDAVLSMKEITNLCFDNDEKESEAKDLSEYKDKYIDVIMQGIIADYGRSLSKEPFQHESLLVDRKEKKLSSAEKRLAQRGYELEKKAAAAPKPTTAYRTVRTADGSIVQRPVASVRPMQHGARWIPADVWRRQGMTAQEMTLPLDVVIPTNSAEKTNIVLKAGQRVMVLKSPKGIYMQLESGKIIAIKTSLKGLGQKGGDAKDAAVKKSILPGRPTSTNIPGSLKNNSAITIQKTGGSRPGFQRVMGRPLMGQQKVMRPILPGQRQPDMRSRGDTKSYTGIRRLPMPHGKMIRPNLPGSLSITKIRKDPKPTNDKDASNKMDMESGDAHVLDSDDEVNDRDARNVSNESAERSDRSRAEDNHSEDSKSNDASYHSAKSKDRKEDSSEAEQGPLVLTTDEKLPSEAALERKACDSKNKQPKEQRNKAENDAAKMEPHESKEQGDKSKISLLKNYRHQRPLNRPAESSLSQLEKTASALNPEGLPAFRQNLDHITQSYSPSEEKPIPKSRKKKPTKIEQLDSINDMPIKSSGKSHSVSSLLKKDSPTHRSDLSNSVPIAPMGLSPSPQRLISPLDEPMGGLGHSSLGPSSVPHASMPLGGPVLDLKGPSQPHSTMAMGSSGPAYPSAHPPTEGAYNQYPPGYAMGYGAYPNGPYYGGGTYGTPPFYPGYPAAPYPPQTPHQPAPAPAPEGYPPPSQQW